MKLLSMSLPIVLIILVIYIRVKYPQNIFGKIIMGYVKFLLLLGIVSLVLGFLICRTCVNMQG